LTIIPLIYIVYYSNLGGLELFWELSPPKSPRGDGTGTRAKGHRKIEKSVKNELKQMKIRGNFV